MLFAHSESVPHLGDDSGNDTNGITAYVILALHGDYEITFSFLIPSNLATSILEVLVAVAVSARS